jgi:hypothetical protein
MTREDLIWKMAEAAWGHHYCPSGASGRLCVNCEADRSSSGEAECFELSGGFKRGPAQTEWRATAEGALIALEKALGISVLGEPAKVVDPLSGMGGGFPDGCCGRRQDLG